MTKIFGQNHKPIEIEPSLGPISYRFSVGTISDRKAIKTSFEIISIVIGRILWPETREFPNFRSKVTEVNKLNQIDLGNKLIGVLHEELFAKISLHLEPIDLPRKFSLAEPNEIALFNYFPESGIGSIVAISPEGQRAEIGLFGRDGMSPTAVALDGETSPFAIFMQVGGAGHRIRSTILVQLLEESAPLRKLLSRYAQSQLVQTAYTALSNSTHHIEERLARWILMCHDRTDGNEIALTHEFLSVMLAVRRPSVTTALHVLEGNGFILAERGLITIRNRAALEAFASDAYGIPEREYRRLVEQMP